MSKYRYAYNIYLTIIICFTKKNVHIKKTTLTQETNNNKYLYCLFVSMNYGFMLSTRFWVVILRCN